MAGLKKTGTYPFNPTALHNHQRLLQAPSPSFITALTPSINLHPSPNVMSSSMQPSPSGSRPPVIPSRAGMHLFPTELNALIQHPTQLHYDALVYHTITLTHS